MGRGWAVRNARVVVIAAAAALLVVAAPVLASIPDGVGTIHGCYSSRNGTLRVIDAGAGATCARGEVAISWNRFTGTPAGGDLDGTYPNPSIRNGAVTADKLDGGAVTSAKLDANAVTSEKILDGTIRSEDLAPGAARASLGAPEAWHHVGTAGEPSFQNGWRNFAAASEASAQAGFYRDALGVVHLKGLIRNDTTHFGAVFQLPDGYRPSKVVMVPVLAVADGSASPGSGLLRVEIDGTVWLYVSSADSVSLDGVSFRTDR